MAEGKKSYIFYLNWYRLFDRLDRDRECQCKRCQLDYLIQDYVSDVYHGVPVSEISSGDDAVDMAFQSIVDDLKPDLEKWKDTQHKRAIAGQLGGLARASNMKQNVANVANAKSSKQNVANQAVNVNVNVNDNVYDNEVSKDTNNNDVSISKDISTSTSEPRELVLELPTIKGNYGTSYPVYKDQVDKWQSIYLGVNVISELNKMYAWLEANPKNKKTYQGMPRFIVNWLSRQQDRASKNGVVAIPTYDDGSYKGFTYRNGHFYEGGFETESVPLDVRIHFEGLGGQ